MGNTAVGSHVFSLTEAARALGMSRRGLRDRHYKHGVGQKIGHRIRFTAQDLAELKHWPHKVGRPKSSKGRKSK